MVLILVFMVFTLCWVWNRIKTLVLLKESSSSSSSNNNLCVYFEVSSVSCGPSHSARNSCSPSPSFCHSIPTPNWHPSFVPNERPSYLEWFPEATSSPPGVTTPTPTVSGLASPRIVADDAKRTSGDGLRKEAVRIRAQLKPETECCASSSVAIEQLGNFKRFSNGDGPKQDELKGRGRIVAAAGNIYSNPTPKKEQSNALHTNTAKSSSNPTFRSIKKLFTACVPARSRNVSGKSCATTPTANGLQRDGFFSWKRRRLSFRPQLKKGELLNKKNYDNKVNDDEVDHQLSNSDSVQNAKSSTESSSKNESCIPSNWEMKELVSRDGQTKLRTNVFLASFDQCSEKAAGESACTAIAAVIAHWLHSNENSMPTRSEYDELITEGSSEWRKLCDNDAYTNLFPDKHFDLETVLEAGLKPVTVLPAKSFTGFFSPEKFESLKGAMSFDEIWNEINNHAGEVDYKPRVYVISWNDHFFVLKVEADAYYIIDSLGERLFEGCKQAYILKFDDSTSMRAKIAKKEVGSGGMVGEEKAICSGKECCKEYIKRFLAAIQVRELEIEEKIGTVSTISLYQRLQIEFHYSSFSSSTISSSLSLSSSSEE